MSDLISTPSQTQSPVSSDAFEALIDLLASDGVDATPSKHTGNHTCSQANTTLRDPSGKLDFDKIRMMFAAQNESRRVQEKHRARSPPHEDGDSDDEPHSHRSTPSTVPSRAHSMSPKPVERSPAGHRRSSTFGNQPWAGIHENVAKEDAAPTLSRQPLSFDELNTALAGAHEEVRSLRQQYDELRALVTQSLGTEIRDQLKPGSSTVKTEKVAPERDSGRDETSNAGSRAQPNAIVYSVPPPPDVPTEVTNLSENEVKRALGVLVSSLNLSPGALASLSAPTASTPPQQSLFPPNPTRQHDLASIARALKFLGTVDELVWRRSSAPSGPRTLLPVYSEENIVALVARLELWERAVRRSPRT